MFDKYFSIKTIFFHIAIGLNGYDLSYIEAIGTIFGLLCIWCAAKENRINFYFGLINVTLFAIIFYQIQLYASLLLQIFFFVVNLYGLYAWKNQDDLPKLKIHWLTRNQQLFTIIGAVISIAILALFINPVFRFFTFICITILQLATPTIIMPAIQPDPYPIMDAAITILSILAMIQMTRKIVENWLVWIVINILSIILYAKQGVYFMSLEYMILLLIAIKGYIHWAKASQTLKL